MKISIIGSGAMGSLFGGKLSKSGEDVILYDVNEAHINRVNQKGLSIHSTATGETLVVYPRATKDPEETRGSDIFIIFVKSTITELVVKQFSSFADNNSIVITLQNGLGNEEIIRNIMGKEMVAAGVTSQGATFLGPGEINHAGNGPTHLCMSDKHNEKLKPFVETLNKAGFEADIEDNIENLVWSKLIINVGINALTAITNLENGRLLEFQDLKSIMDDLVAEGVAVAAEKGVTLTFPDPLQTVFDVAEKTAKNRSSMLQDFDRGNRTEIDFINGAIVREGSILGINTPVNKTIAGLVRTMERIKNA
ncbi:MAG: 2-dehydropantoate 2-reductase [Spirochaetes bacterium]|nr:MAG: 2-dehydropantoate 2-reductase [Spirochaetota bacterium]